MLAIHLHGFTNELFSLLRTFGRRGQGQGGSLAIFTLNNDFLGRCIEAFQSAFIGNDFSATCISGTKGHGADRQECECLFHRGDDFLLLGLAANVAVSVRTIFLIRSLQDKNIFLMRTCCFFLITLCLISFTTLQAHPVPDIPVRADFQQDGSCTISIEVDPRCFATDPNAEPSLLHAVLPDMKAAARQEMFAKAKQLVMRYVEFSFAPSGSVQPDFKFHFSGHGGTELRDPEDIVVMTGIWHTRVPTGSTGWQIRAMPATPLAVVFRNYQEGLEQPKFSVLFPGETSPVFDLAKPPLSLRRIVFGSCIHRLDHPMLDRAASLPMDVFLFMGDNIYADTTDMRVMRDKYRALAASTFFQTIRTKAPILATWDDHDLGLNDGGADYPMRVESQKEFFDWLNEPAWSKLRKQEGVYQSRILGPPGQRTQIILLDTRYFRSPLKRVSKEVAQPGGTAIPHQDTRTTILGDKQWEWLEQSLCQPAELRLIVSSIQFAAEACGSESWANFPHEQRRLIELINKTKAKGVVFLSGDRHWSEVSALQQAVPYPLYDITASSLTQLHQRGAPTQNRHRVIDRTYHQPNVGALDIDWQATPPDLNFRILDEHGQAQLETRISLGALQGKGW